MSAVFIGYAGIRQKLAIPLFISKIKAGFPSPAQDYVERTLDLNELCIRHPNATFFVRVEGDSMIEAGIFDGDVLVVDRSIEAVHGHIVVASVGGEFTVKEYCTRPVMQLLPRNPAYQPIRLREGDEMCVFGVVIANVRKFLYT